MMMLSMFLDVLSAKPRAALRFVLPDGSFVPPQAHVTEVARVRKDFVDCGGVRRSTDACVLQLWVDAGDAAHRVNAGKLAEIIGLGRPLLGDADLAVEVEYDVGFVTQFAVTAAESTPSGVLFRLKGRHTACLAPDRCGVGAAATEVCCASTASAGACCGS